MVKAIRFSFLLSLILIILFQISFAQEISVKATADTNSALIGDQIRIEIRAKAPSDMEVIFPAKADTLGKLEWLAQSAIDTVCESGTCSFRRTLVVTCFDTGFVEAPPFVFMYGKKGAFNLFPIETEPLYFYFATMDVDTALPIKDIKGPLDVPLTLEEILPYLIAGLAIALIAGALAFYFMRKKPKPRFDLGYDPTIPPHVAALQALKDLDADKLWQKGLVKEYYIRLTEIVRLYIERRFEINALEMTSDEIITATGNAGIDEENISRLLKIFATADLAKFAKYVSMPEENILCFQYANSFVGSTTKIEDTKDIDVKFGKENPSGEDNK